MYNRSLVTNSSHNAIQWHFVLKEHNNLSILSSLTIFKNRVLIPLKDLGSLVTSQTFLGYCKEVNINLGIETVVYNCLTTSNAMALRCKPKLSNFLLRLLLLKFGGPSTSINFTLLKQLSVIRIRDSYKQVLSYSSSIPIILCNTSDCRAWIVPTLGVILHIMHIWASLQGSYFPALNVSKLPFTIGNHDIG